MADAMLQKVKQYAAELEAQGKSAGYAYATAWARACKYHPELDAAGHCKRPRRQYLAVKAARRVLGSLHKRCRELRLGGDVLYWAAMAKGVQTAPYVYGQHTVLKYGREAFAPSLDTAAAIDQVVSRGRTGSLGAHPPETMAPAIDRVLGIGPRRNPRPTVVRRNPRRETLIPVTPSLTSVDLGKVFRQVTLYRTAELRMQDRGHYPRELLIAVIEQLRGGGMIGTSADGMAYLVAEPISTLDVESATRSAYEDRTGEELAPAARQTRPAATKAPAAKKARPAGTADIVWKQVGDAVYPDDIVNYAEEYFPRFCEAIRSWAGPKEADPFDELAHGILDVWQDMGVVKENNEGELVVTGEPIFERNIDHFLEIAPEGTYSDEQVGSFQRLFAEEAARRRPAATVQAAPVKPAPKQGRDPYIWKKAGEPVTVFDIQRFARKHLPRLCNEYGDRALLNFCATVMNRWASEDVLVIDKKTLMSKVKGPDPLYMSYLLDCFDDLQMSSRQRQIFREDVRNFSPNGPAAKTAARPAAPADDMWKDVGQTFDEATLISHIRRKYPAFCQLVEGEGYTVVQVADDLIHMWSNNDDIKYEARGARYKVIGEGIRESILRASINTVLAGEFDDAVYQQIKESLRGTKEPKRSAKAAASKWEGIKVRWASDSAGQFPKRCRGGPSSNKQTMQYRFTIIAPLCQMPVACVVQTNDRPHHNYCVSPDMSRSYSGGYFGGTHTIDGKQWMRQHMQPGVLAHDDFGQGVGPANYMSGPLHAVCDRGVGVVGTYSEVFGRTTAADAAWANLLKHHVTKQSIENMRRKRIPIVSPLRLSTQATKASGMRAIGNAVPDTVEVIGGDHVYDILEARTILSLGIVLHVEPRWQAAVTHYRDPSTPYVCPADMWQFLDLSATDLDSLHKFLLYCSDHNGLDKPAGYLRAAQESLALNPSCPIVPEDLPKFFTDDHFPALKGAAKQTKKRNPAGPRPAARNLHAFLSDPSWGDRPTRENPRSAASEAWVAKFPRHHFDRPARPSTEVRAHFNLHTGGYSVDTKGPEGWRMRDDDIPSLTLLNATFEYAPSKHRKYFESGKRDVHAWVYGTEDSTAPRLDDGVWRPCHYSKDPPCFIDRATKQCLPTDGSVDVYLASASNVDPSTGKPRKSIYSQGRALPWKPDAWWRPSKRPNPRRRRSK